MMTAMPTLPPLALKHIADLKSKGIEPTIEEAIWLVALCERVLCPVSGERSDLCGMPVRVGISDVWLWPLTIGASVWLLDYCLTWWSSDKDRDRLTMATFFALANGRDRTAIQQASYSREVAEDIVGEWALSLNCTRDELEEAADLVLPKPAVQPDDGQKRQMDWDAICGEIEAACGIPADHWVWEVSKAATLRAYSRSKAVLHARAGGQVAASDDPLNEAIQNLASAKRTMILSRREKEKAGK